MVNLPNTISLFLNIGLYTYYYGEYKTLAFVIHYEYNTLQEDLSWKE